MVLCEAGTTANSWPPMLTICGHTPDQHFVAPQHCSINSMARPCHRQNRKRRQAPHPTLYGLPCNELKHCRRHLRPLHFLLPPRQKGSEGRTRVRWGSARREGAARIQSCTPSQTARGIGRTTPRSSAAQAAGGRDESNALTLSIAILWETCEEARSLVKKFSFKLGLFCLYSRSL